MSCGCGGKCCAETRGPLAVVAGLALLNARPSNGLGFLYWGGESGGGGDWWDDLTQEEYNYLFDNYGGGGGDFWGFDQPYWTSTGDGGPSFNVDFNWNPQGFLPANQQPQSTDGNWQRLLDWWRELTTPHVIQPPTPSPSTLPPYTGYCPPNTYCVDYPNCSKCAPLDATQANKTNSAARKPGAQQAKPKTSPQNPQPCPAPGRTNPATGKCECPKGLLYDAKTQRCIPATLSNRLTQPGPGGFPWWLLLLGGAVVIKAASNSGKK